MLKRILLLISIAVFLVVFLYQLVYINLRGFSEMDYSPKPITMSEVEGWPEDRSGVSVLNYNIRDLLWPTDSDRSKVAVDIGHSLGEMRKQGIHPNVVLLQEAFRKGAENVNRGSKYPYVVYGPDKSPKLDTYPISEEFQKERSWIKGEKSNKNLLNSGLAILSDYPITSVKRIAFPRGMCAGYDCLASKGVLIAWIQVPDIDEPVAFVTTHLNSRDSSHVSKERADEGYYHQVKMLQHVIETEIDSNTTVVIGGDINATHAERRLYAVQKYLTSFGYQDGIRKAYEAGNVHDTSIRHIENALEDNYNLILLKNTPEQKLKPRNVWVPFPRYTSEAHSDHSGIILDLSLVED